MTPTPATADPAGARDGGAVELWRQGSPVGELVVGVGPGGLCRVGFAERGGRGGMRALAGPDPRDEPGSPLALAAAEQLDDYLAGRRERFDLEVDLSSVGGFHRTVLGTLHAEVGFGETVSYGELAARSGRPRAARAVGQAMHRNPVSIVVPCHRVVAADGGLGGYGGGLDVKARLLALERRRA